MEFLVLGPLRVLDTGRPVTIAAPRQRALLAALLVHANEVVSTDRLLDLVWGGSDSEVGVSTLRFHISKLRAALEPDRESGQDGIISTQTPGYVLRATPGQIDALGFESVSREAREVLATDPGQALKLLDDALSMWQGSAYADFTYDEFARLEILRLEELRLAAMEDRFDALLALGRERETISDLQALVEEHPHRERLTGALMLALYRSGRQADALAAFQALRRELGEGLGIEPSKELVDLEGRILLQDETLSVGAAPPAAQFLRGYALRGRIGEGAHGIVWRAAQPGVGREVAIKAIHPDIANRPGFVRRFEMEAQLVASLEHPHIVSLFDFWRDPEGAYLVMPYLRGGNLAHLLQQGPLRPDTALALIGDIGDALSYAHRRGVVHRDVTPQNVLLDDEGNPYLSDFGVAALIGETGPPTSSSPAYLAPEQRSGHGAVPASDVFSLGVLAHSVLSGEIPTVDHRLDATSLLNPNVPGGVDEVIARATATDVSSRFADPGEFVAALAAALNGQGGPISMPVVDVRNPYKGLRVFREADSPDFFGRDVVVSELVDAVARHRLVAVVGPSGCGKSSLVRAGLVADLRQGVLPGSERWLITDMYPGTRPLAEMEEALLRVAVERPDNLAEMLSADDVAAVVGGLLPRDGELLLVVDQFEELFTQAIDELERRRFLDTLTALASSPKSRTRVVVTLRADFYDRPLGYSGFGDLMRRGLVSITVPSAESLEQAVIGPAEAVGLTVEPGLARVITRHVEDQPGGLPLLEFALTELFHERVGEELTAAGYQRTGGVLGALGRRAEDLYVGCDESGREAIRQVFLRLVTVEEGAEDTRRRIPLTELHEIGLKEEALGHVLDDYGSHRLITFDRDPETREPTVEVAHEALLSKWDRLSGWIDDRRDDLVVHRRLTVAAKEWQESEWNPAYLTAGGRLDHFETFAAETDIALTGAERQLLEASRRTEDDVATRRKRQRLAVLTAFASAAVVAIILAVVALVAQRQAEEEAALNRAQVLTAESRDATSADHQLALLLATEAADVGRAASGEVLPGTVEALHHAILASRLEEVIPLDGAPPGQIVGVDISPFGMVALSAPGDTVELRSSDNLETVIAVLGTPVGGANVAYTSTPSFDPSGKRLAVVGSEGAVHVWDVDSRADLWSSARHENGDGGAAVFSPDGTALVTVGGGSMVMWEAATGNEIWAVPAGGGDSIPAFSSDGTRLAVGTWGLQSVQVLDAVSGEEIIAHVVDMSVGSVLWSPDEVHLFVGLEVGDIAVMDGATLETVDVWRGHTRTPMAMTLDPSGTRVVTGADDGTTRVWDWKFGEELMVVAGGADAVDSFAFFPDANQLLASAPDATLRLYDVSAAGPGEVLGTGLGGAIYGIDFSPDGTRLAAHVFGGEFDSAGVVIWDIASDVPLVTVGGLNWWAYNGVAFSSDGAAFVVQDWDESAEQGDLVGPSWGPVQLRDATTGEPLMSFTDSAGRERQALVLSEAGNYLATGSSTSFFKEPPWVSTASVHDLSTGALLHRLDHADWGVTAVAPSPSGDLLATATCGPGRIALWDLSSETTSWSDDFPGCSTGIEFGPDGSFIAASNVESASVVWDAVTGDRRFEIAGHSGGTLSIAISPDGRVVASAGSDGSVLVVDSATGEVVKRIQVADVGIGDVDFSPDGSSLAASTTDGSLFIFVLDPDELVDLARNRTFRTFTKAECAAYEIDPCPAEE